MGVRFWPICAFPDRLKPARSGRWTQWWQMGSVTDAAFESRRRQGLPSLL